MYQGNFISFLKKHNPNITCIIIQIIHKKLLKLFLNNLFDCLNGEYYFFKQKLILVSADLGFLHQALSILNFFDVNNLFFSLKKKKQIVNKLVPFNIDIQEENLLYKEESKKKTYKKKSKKYKFIKKNFNPYYSLDFSLEIFSKSKNFLYLKNVFPNNNILSTKFFLNFLFNYFNDYKATLFNSFFFLKIKNFFIFCIILNSVILSNRLYYFLLIKFCQQYIK